MAYNCCVECGSSLGFDDSTHKLCIPCEDRERVLYSMDEELEGIGGYESVWPEGTHPPDNAPTYTPDSKEAKP